MADSGQHERILTEALDARPSLKLWLEGMRAWAFDRSGRRIMVGLSAVETLEFLRLDAVVDPLNPDASPAEQDENRYYELRERHDEARRRDAMENIVHLSEGGSKN